MDLGYWVMGELTQFTLRSDKFLSCCKTGKCLAGTGRSRRGVRLPFLVWQQAETELTHCEPCPEI